MKKTIRLNESQLRHIVTESVKRILSEEKLNRYVMSWSQADNAWMVVYAHDLEEAEELFEDGEYTLEEDDGELEDEE